MAKGSVSVNSDVVSSILANLTSVYSTFSSDIVSSVDGDFSVLRELGFGNCLDKIKSQATSLTNSQKSIIDSIASHLAEMEETEETLNNNFNNSYSGGTYVGDASSGSEENSGSDYDVDDDEDGKAINAEELSDIISSLSEDDKKSLLSLINMYKDEGTSLNDLLMNYNNSEELYKILKTVLGSSVDMPDLSKEDTELIQKTLLNTIVSSETEYQELNTNSILMAKEYLGSVCSEYRITASELIHDDLYKNVLKTSIKNLYNGNVDNVSDSEILEFRKFVDDVALNNNTNAIDIIDNNIQLLL